MAGPRKASPARAKHSGRKTLPATVAAGGNNLLATLGGHAGAETMAALTNKLAGLIGAFHRIALGSSALRFKEQTRPKAPQTERLQNRGRLNVSPDQKSIRNLAFAGFVRDRVLLSESEFIRE
jgi:hypothetical protein